VQTFAELIHEQNRAGIMVTHDLRMCRYVDRVIQMVDGKVSREIADRNDILRLAGALDSMNGVGESSWAMEANGEHSLSSSKHSMSPAIL
jgi:putative ABC transport system ATP-binding protein